MKGATNKYGHPVHAAWSGGIQSIRRPLRGCLLYGEMIRMQINKVAFIGKGGVGLLYGSMIAKALGNDAVEYVMVTPVLSVTQTMRSPSTASPVRSSPSAPARQRPPIWSS